jgi:hypothetical protein
MTLNPRLERDKGVQLTVRLGIHTGPVVVGEMGGGGRHETLATGETVNIASRLEGLAVPNTVLSSPITARLVRDAFALEDFGLHCLKGVAEPMQVFRVLGPLEVHEDETVAVYVSGGYTFRSCGAPKPPAVAGQPIYASQRIPDRGAGMEKFNKLKGLDERLHPIMVITPRITTEFRGLQCSHKNC